MITRRAFRSLPSATVTKIAGTVLMKSHAQYDSASLSNLDVQTTNAYS